jgi:hypothetical protein
MTEAFINRTREKKPHEMLDYRRRQGKKAVAEG